MRRHFKRFVVIPAIVILCITGFAGSPAFLPDAYLRHVKYLASDELKGRENGSPELDKAADYIAQEFKSSGLKPAGDDETYFQKFMLATGSKLGPTNTLSFTIRDSSLEAALQKDFVPVGVGEQTSVRGDLAFAGYGISALEYGYDDYKSLKVVDKIVLVLSDTPRENSPSNPFKDAGASFFERDITKAINAKYRGARAILIVQDPLNHPDEAKELPDLSAGTQIEELGICVLRISRRVAQQLLESQGKDLLDLQKKIDENLEQQSFDFSGVRASLEMDVSRVKREVRNVVGFLPGKDSSASGEFIILGAHYDHLGLGGQNSQSAQLIGQIHNGADDNASGTAGILELAAALARDGEPRKRSYLFIAFAGEELGLHGSTYWTEHPTRALERAVAMINLDMIGRSRSNQVFVNFAGTSPEFPKLVAESAAAAGIEAKTSQSGPSGSDHMAFYAKNMPVLFFFSGLHADYHRPSDDWDKINAPGAVKILNMVYRVAVSLNEAGRRPQFTKIETAAPTSHGTGGGGGYGSYFGSIPDMTSEVKGVRFADVRPESPAAQAGLKGGDVLIRFAGAEIANLEDFTFMLRKHKPGEEVEVTVLRENNPLSVSVKLGVRR
jgi:hypothetical protein